MGKREKEKAHAPGGERETQREKERERERVRVHACGREEEKEREREKMFILRNLLMPLWIVTSPESAEQDNRLETQGIAGTAVAV